ncbi:MAG: hypothetical protein WAX77_00470 [Methylococcaceae bacterium]
MTHFLWVEDFNASETKRSENIISSTVDDVFGSILNKTELMQRLSEEDANDAQDFLEENGVLLKLDLLEALEFIRNPQELIKVDFVVLDVDMPLGNEKRDTNNYLPSLIEEYQSKEHLQKIAGYQIYTELVIEKGFPKKHILFCSNHAGYFEELKSKFASANIKPPVSPNPNEPFLKKADKAFINQWLNEARSDYFVLRRGIIEGCRYLKEELLAITKEQLQFNECIKGNKKVDVNEINDYLAVLEDFFPLRQPSDTKTLYKLFIRTLSHEWEATDPNTIKSIENKTQLAFSRIMKTTRNWITHNPTAIFNHLTAQDVAYLFLCNMRAMFKLNSNVEKYESILFLLFNEDDVTFQSIQSKIKNHETPLIEKYISYFDESKKDKVDIYEIINGLQDNKQKVEQHKNDRFFISMLYQLFWFSSSSQDNTTNNTVNKHDEKSHQVIISRTYSFKPFDYAQSEFLLKFASHIYNRSF